MEGIDFYIKKGEGEKSIWGLGCSPVAPSLLRYKTLNMILNWRLFGENVLLAKITDSRIWPIACYLTQPMPAPVCSSHDWHPAGPIPDSLRDGWLWPPYLIGCLAGLFPCRHGVQGRVGHLFLPLTENRNFCFSKGWVLLGNFLKGYPVGLVNAASVNILYFFKTTWTLLKWVRFNV